MWKSSYNITYVKIKVAKSVLGLGAMGKVDIGTVTIQGVWQDNENSRTLPHFIVDFVTVCVFWRYSCLQSKNYVF